MESLRLGQAEKTSSELNYWEVVCFLAAFQRFNFFPVVIPFFTVR